MPNTHQTGDTFAGGTWIGRSMNPWTNATAYETSNISVGSGTNIYRGITFTSPAVASAVNLGAGTWTIGINCRESNGGANAYVRYMIYKWNAADSLGTTIVAAGNHNLEMSTTAAPGAVRTISVTGNAVSLAAGDKIAVDIEVRTSSSSGNYTVSYFFGNNAQGSLAMPGFVTFNYADPGQTGYGHNINLYTGLHMASNFDEDLTYISNNKHVECTDCHNMHSAGSEKHSDRGTATSGTTTILTDTSKTWTVNQWAGSVLAIVGGTDSGQSRTISSNTATTITVSSAFSAALNNTSVYQIVSGSNAVSNVLKGVSGAVMGTTTGAGSKCFGLH